MGDFLSIYAAVQPDKPAVIEHPPGVDAVVVTFAELEERANRLANALIALGSGPGQKVIWCGPNSLGVVDVVNAARKVGATAVPLNYRLSPEEAAYVTDHCDATVVLVDAEYAELFRAIRADIPKVTHVLVYGGEPLEGQESVEKLTASAPATAPPERDAEVAATMIYTSGTTGKPKGALRSAPADPQAVAALLGLIGCAPDDIYITTGPLYHSGPGGFMAIAQALGQTVVLQRKFDPEDWLRLVDNYRVTATFSAPTPIRMICSLPDEVRARYDRSSRSGCSPMPRRGAWPSSACTRRLPRRLAVGDLRLDRARSQHRARAGRSAAQARIVRSGGADGRDRAVRRRRQRGHRHRPGPSR
jgi:fatty-acyl-CoA synthase/long-chain acyl-CoA synthetase